MVPRTTLPAVVIDGEAKSCGVTDQSQLALLPIMLLMLLMLRLQIAGQLARAW